MPDSWEQKKCQNLVKRCKPTKFTETSNWSSFWAKDWNNGWICFECNITYLFLIRCIECTHLIYLIFAFSREIQINRYFFFFFLWMLIRIYHSLSKWYQWALSTGWIIIMIEPSSLVTGRWRCELFRENWRKLFSISNVNSIGNTKPKPKQYENKTESERT